MHPQRARLVLVEPKTSKDPCGHCNARQRSMCRAIDFADLERLSRVAVSRTIPRGQIFIEEGQPASAFFNITAGTVKLFKLLPDGREQITGFAGVGHFLGLAVTDTYAFSAEAIESVQACRFARPQLCDLLDDFPALERELLKMGCDELVAAQDQMLLLGRKTAQERLASFIIARSRDATLCGFGADRIRLPMTRGEIAAYLGLTIETVSRTFTRFRTGKRLETPSNDEIRILDRAWLEAMANGTVTSVDRRPSGCQVGALSGRGLQIDGCPERAPKSRRGSNLGEIAPDAKRHGR